MKLIASTFPDSAILILMIAGCSPSSETNQEVDQAVFQRIGADHSGIDFVNTNQENIATKENVFDFDYFYNGSGVAAVDINNDDLLDVVFAANQSQNKIYLNKGNLQFEDITEQAGINEGKGWSTGVSFADVNQDGWQDIYISQGGPYPGEKSRNLLFINQGDLTFKEQAANYGLADASISSQSAFFDYDKDGDLDCIVMNENVLYGADPMLFFSQLDADEELKHHSSGHLYENRNGQFKDVTKTAGLLNPSFGLGLIVSDINEDGWLDIYIANDYYVPDAMYINQGDGTFQNEIGKYTDQVSFFGMGVDIADINNDELQDIFVLDMASTDHYRSKTLMASMSTEAFDLLVNDLGLHHQYMFNSLQLNQGANRFENVAQLTAMAKSDWSWAVLMNDYDLDGNTDVFITNGYKKYALNNDIRTKVLEAKRTYRGKVPIEIKQEIYDQLPSEKLPNMMFRNLGNLAFEDVSEKWGLSDPSFSNGAIHADLDNDGDLDLLINNLDEPAFLYQNLSVEKKIGNYLTVKTTGSDASFAKIWVSTASGVQFREQKTVRGYLSASQTAEIFGLGNVTKVDTVRVEWLSGKYQEVYDVDANSALIFDEKEAKGMTDFSIGAESEFIQPNAQVLGIDYLHQENEFDDFELESLLPYKQSTLGPCLAVGDINGDNLDDFYVGGALNQSGKLYLQATNGAFNDVTSASIAQDAIHEDLDAVFFDVDNDGDEDLFVVSGGYEFENEADEYVDRLYINDGFGKFQKATSTSLANYKLSGKSVGILDYDNDGLRDIVVGNRIVPGAYPKSPRSILFKNTGSTLQEVTQVVIPGLLDFGMVNDIIGTDFNQDGWEDLIVVGEWTGIGLFQNNEGVFENVTPSNSFSDVRGWWFSVQELDVNNDLLPDYVVGNLGLNTKYKASVEEPLKIYASDFDGNDTWDIVLSNSYKGQYVPFRGRECSSGQMPFIAQEFPTFDLFAKATLEDVYGDRLNDAYHKFANEFRSVLLLNKGNGVFDLTPLPVEAQISPILDMEILDINNDGYDDVFAIGTIYNTEVETPRFDAGSGLILVNDREGRLVAQPDLNRQLYVEGNLKSVESIKIQDTSYLLIGRNNEAPAFVKMPDNRPTQ